MGCGKVTDVDYFKLPTPMSWNLMSYFDNFGKDHTFEQPLWIHWSWWSCGFGIYEAENNPSCLFMVNELLIPNWSKVLPLTLVAAFIYLSKPRRSPPMKTLESILEKLP